MTPSFTIGTISQCCFLQEISLSCFLTSPESEKNQSGGVERPPRLADGLILFLTDSVVIIEWIPVTEVLTRDGTNKGKTDYSMER